MANSFNFDVSEIMEELKNNIEANKIKKKYEDMELKELQALCKDTSGRSTLELKIMTELLKEKMFEQKFLRNKATTQQQRVKAKVSSKLLSLENDSDHSDTLKAREKTKSALDRLLPVINTFCKEAVLVMDERSAYRKKGARLLQKQAEIERQIEEAGTYAAA